MFTQRSTRPPTQLSAAQSASPAPVPPSPMPSPPSSQEHLVLISCRCCGQAVLWPITSAQLPERLPPFWGNSPFFSLSLGPQPSLFLTWRKDTYQSQMTLPGPSVRAPPLPLPCVGGGPYHPSRIQRKMLAQEERRQGSVGVGVGGTGGERDGSFSVCGHVYVLAVCVCLYLHSRKPHP